MSYSQFPKKLKDGKMHFPGEKPAHGRNSFCQSPDNENNDYQLRFSGEKPAHDRNSFCQSPDNENKDYQLRYSGEKPAHDRNSFCQSPDNKNKDDQLRYSTSDNEIGDPIECYTSKYKEDAGQGLEMNFHEREKFSEVIKTREMCRIGEYTNPQQGCNDNETYDGEMHSSFPRQSFLENNEHKESRIVTKDHDNDADVPSGDSIYSNDDIEKKIETEQKDGDKNPPQNTEESPQCGVVSDTNSIFSDTYSIGHTSETGEMGNGDDSENDSFSDVQAEELRQEYTHKSNESLHPHQRQLNKTETVHNDANSELNNNNKYCCIAPESVGDEQHPVDNTNTEKITRASIAEHESGRLNTTLDQRLKANHQVCSQNLSVRNSGDQPKAAASPTCYPTLSLNNPRQECSTYGTYVRDMHKAFLLANLPILLNLLNTPSYNLLKNIMHIENATETAGYDNDADVSPEDRNHRDEYIDENAENEQEHGNKNQETDSISKVSSEHQMQDCAHIPHENLLPETRHGHTNEICSSGESLQSDQKKYSFSTQHKTHGYTSNYKSLGKEINHETKTSDLNVTAGKRKYSVKEHVGNNDTALKDIRDIETGVSVTHPFNKNFDHNKDVIKRCHESTSANVAVDNMNTSHNRYIETQTSNFDKSKTKLSIYQSQSYDNKWMPSIDSAVSAQRAMTSSNGDEGNNADMVHASQLVGQCDSEINQPWHEFYTYLDGHLLSFEAIHGIHDDVNTETPISFKCYGDEDYRLNKAQSMDSLMSATDSSLPIADENRTPLIAPSRLFSLSSRITSASIDDQMSDLTSAFNVMEMRQKRTLEDSGTDEETRQKGSYLLSSQSNLGSKTPDKSVAFQTVLNCCRPIRAESQFNIVLRTIFNHGDALHADGKGVFVVPFHGMYLLRFQAVTKSHDVCGQELSIGIELNQHETNSQSWLCLQTVPSDIAPKSVEKTFVLRPGDSVYVKVEHVKGFRSILRSVIFEGHSLYRIVK